MYYSPQCGSHLMWQNEWTVRGHCLQQEEFNYEVRLDQGKSIQYTYCCISTATIYEQTNFLVKLIYMDTDRTSSEENI